MIKIQICLLVAVLVLGAIQSFVILPVEVDVVDFEDSYVPAPRDRRSPNGSLELKGTLGPGGQGGVDATYTHQVWKGRKGQSFELNGGYSGQYGSGRPNHNFGIGGIFRF